MALAASRTTRLGVIEWNPSGIGFLAGAMITSPFYEFLGHGQFTLLPGSRCKRTVKNRRHRRDRKSKTLPLINGDCTDQKSNHKEHGGTQRKLPKNPNLNPKPLKRGVNGVSGGERRSP